MDIFLVRGKDVGKVERLAVWHNNTGKGPDWHLDKVRGQIGRNFTHWSQ